MSFSLEGKTCLVTGASRGIGKAIALALGAAGADVALTYARSEDAAKDVQAQLVAMGRKAMIFQADAVSGTRAEEVVNELVKAWGRLDILVNNAGITKDTLIMRMSEEQWDDVIETNLKSVFNYSKAVVRPMMKQRAGSVINIGSVVGVSGNAGQTNYSASKAGMIGFTKSLAKELATRNVRVNLVAPGYITTDMTDKLNEATLQAINSAIPMGKPGNPEDIAMAVQYLASDASAYVTGAVLHVDGGMAM
ncbi:MAG: 3-oxoacyl-[acyl-carrier-protein] reductase [Bacteroidetes bacterium HLUCCA01]|nr:MAG: 3-oxoacyl-[acyl-carrier-protein] reductase [Bacteroidetes bacterium HLUCCA01]